MIGHCILSIMGKAANQIVSPTYCTINLMQKSTPLLKVKGTFCPWSKHQMWLWRLDLRFFWFVMPLNEDCAAVYMENPFVGPLNWRHIASLTPWGDSISQKASSKVLEPHRLSFLLIKNDHEIYSYLISPFSCDTVHFTNSSYCLSYNWQCDYTRII